MTQTIASTNTQVIFAQDPGTGFPDPQVHMKVVTAPVETTLKEGELLLKNLFLSVDPYMRGRMNTGGKSYTSAFQLGKPLSGGGIAVVAKSNREGYQEGDLVTAHIGWEEYTILPSALPAQRIVNPLDVQLEYFLGILGMPGATAYHGLLDIGEPKAGETVFVSGAAGAVGLVVGQIAKIKGCHVVGSAGSDEKVDLLLNEYGFDAAFNYKTVANQAETLAQLCPNGIDVYFDNVGGETLDIVFTLANTFARFVECGMISQYNATPENRYHLKNTMMIVGKQIKMQGFIIGSQMGNKDFMKRFVTDMMSWIANGKLKYRVSVVEGIQNAPQGFVDMLKGSNIGKQVIKIADL
ncbi:hypothetical protein HDV03_000982 [Kappamyces sp. JEL0829]|nr:hypothetical protein HDV03_000982 [Kappamyces sp. JEL0829]